MAAEPRAIAREIAYRHLKAGEPLGWFDALYCRAGDDAAIIPWADLIPNPNLVDWLEHNPRAVRSRALKVGCGLGDDAEELARRGFETTAFDISAAAIAKRFLSRIIWIAKIRRYVASGQPTSGNS